MSFTLFGAALPASARSTVWLIADLPELQHGLGCVDGRGARRRRGRRSRRGVPSLEID